MMTSIGDKTLLDNVEAYYSAKLAEYGATSKGVDWNSESSQLLRFRELLRTADVGTDDSILDYGCGFGSLWPVMKQGGYRGKYTGFDISANMISQARKLHGEDGLAWVTDLPPSARYDFVIASGIFNVKLGHSGNEWHAYMMETIDKFRTLSRKGFVFNALTAYSDQEYRRKDLFYADPLEWFDFCKRNISSHVVLNHGYPLYEFTMAVLKMENE